jgi:dTMP kinase
MKSTGRLIILEGADGTGTTTQSKLLFDWLLKNHPQVEPVLTAEPTTSSVGSLLRDILNKKVHTRLSSRSMAALFYADRVEHFESIIQPSLDRGNWVICDRNWQSTLVYQGITQSGSEAHWITSLHSGLIPQNSHCFILDTSLEVAQRRCRARNEPEQLYEAEAFQACVLNAYRKIPYWDWKSEIISCGSDSSEDVHKMLRNQIEYCYLQNVLNDDVQNQ